MKKVVYLLTLLSLIIFPFDLAQADTPTNADPIKQNYMDIQTSSKASDVSKIKSTIDAYFLTQMESKKTDDIVEFGFLFSNGNKNKIFEDEFGRLKYELLGLKYYDSAPTWYEYKPQYAKIDVNGNKAQVAVRPFVDVKYANSGDRIETIYGPTHNISLTKETRWKIQNDEYFDENIDAFPRGTNWNKLIGEFYSKKIREEAEQQKLKAKLKEKV